MPEHMKIKPQSLADYLELLSKIGFQAGLAWGVVEAKWDGIREAFRGFDPVAVSQMTPIDVDRLLENPALIRSRKKIEAVIDNADTLLELDREYEGFTQYLRSHQNFEAAARDLRRRFRFLALH